MKNRRFFNFKLYLSGLKQLAELPAIIIAMLILTSLSGMHSVSFLLAIFSHIILIPIMAFYIYNYATNPSNLNLNEHTKASIIISFTMSLFTCSFVMLLSIIPSLIYTESGNDILYFIGLFSTYLLLVVTFFLAWTLSKSLLSYIAISLAILLSPLIIIVTYILCPFLDYERISVLFNSEYSMYNLRVYDYSYIPGIIFTSALSIILLLIAIIFPLVYIPVYLPAGSQAPRTAFRGWRTSQPLPFPF